MDRLQYVLHNHPSGDPAPSRADVQMTQAIVDITKRLGIAVHDHIIVGKETGPLPVGNPARPTAPAGSNRSRLLRCMSRVVALNRPREMSTRQSLSGAKRT